MTPEEKIAYDKLKDAAPDLYYRLCRTNEELMYMLENDGYHHELLQRMIDDIIGTIINAQGIDE